MPLYNINEPPIAHEAETHHAFDLICWINAEKEEDIHKAYRNVIEWIDWLRAQKQQNYQRFTNGADISLNVLKEMVEKYLTDPNTLIQSALFIYDNAPSFAFAKAIMPYCGYHIVTTRNQDIPEEVLTHKLILEHTYVQESGNKTRLGLPFSLDAADSPTAPAGKPTKISGHAEPRKVEALTLINAQSPQSLLSGSAITTVDYVENVEGGFLNIGSGQPLPTIHVGTVKHCKGGFINIGCQK
ncbi:MAG: hypothetical protein Q8K36_03295 [Alphaproteobacteria bacterium]|nr:hypothetical protein [Alphaproteobacteria bacterium]